MNNFNYSEAEIQEGLKLLEQKRRRQARLRERMERGEVVRKSISMRELREKNPELYEKRKLQNRRRNAQIILLARKALEAGLTVSEEEIDEYISAQ